MMKLLSLKNQTCLGAVTSGLDTSVWLNVEIVWHMKLLQLHQVNFHLFLTKLIFPVNSSFDSFFFNLIPNICLAAELWQWKVWCCWVMKDLAERVFTEDS